LIQIDHIAVPVRDASAAARFLASILGLSPPERDGADGDLFRVAVGAGSFLLFTTAATVVGQHIAFRVDAVTFPAVVRRLRDSGLPFGNAPDDHTNGKTTDPRGGRGLVYFVDRDGHLFEVRV
jgi:catechol 2,3-dioxygenase-like lactoylglutathione lyase family enzyme